MPRESKGKEDVDPGKGHPVTTHKGQGLRRMRTREDRTMRFVKVADLSWSAMGVTVVVVVAVTGWVRGLW